MKVSIVIPAYNEELYIEACLSSLTSQEIPADEIIVVNNNSKDKTVDIAKKFHVKIVTEKEQGMIPARNRGFNEAQYEIIAQTDADTIVPPDWIKKIKKHFQDKKLVGLSGPGDFYEVPEILPAPQWGAMKIIISYAKIVKGVLKHDIIYGPNKALRKNAWEKIKNEVCLEDTQVHEDLDLAIHLATVGNVKFDPTFIVHSSFRRWKKLQPYFEYTYRGIKSIRKHKQLALKKRGKNLMNRLVAKVSFLNQFKHHDL